MQFEVPDIDEYAEFIADTAGTIALAVRGLSDDELDAVKAQAGAALERFQNGGGLCIPGAVLCAVAS